MNEPLSGQVISTPKKKRNNKPTKKQLTAINLVNQGMTPRQAMLRAGYSKNVAGNPKKKLFKASGVQTLTEKFQAELSSVGLTTAYLSNKYKEWLEATRPTTVKVGVDDKGKPILSIADLPDYHTQLEAGKMLKEAWNITPKKEDNQTLTRKITLEEYLKD